MESLQCMQIWRSNGLTKVESPTLGLLSPVLELVAEQLVLDIGLPMQRGENAYPSNFDQLSEKASSASAPRSGLQLTYMYLEIRKDRKDANRSMLRGPQRF